MNRVLHHIGQLATCPNDNAQADAGLVQDAALVIEGERIAWCGPESELPGQYAGWPRHDCEGGLVIPGLVDCHTHLCFGGWRGGEFELRLQGASYLEIQEAGGGIAATVRHTREAGRGELADKARVALDGMLALGVTTVECKSGYGLDRDTELRLLEIYAALDDEHPLTLVPTYLGAHVVPEEYKDDREGYLDLVCDEVLPEIARRGLAKYCDAFIEKGAFTPQEGRRLFRVAQGLGLGIKVHADQLSDGGGATLAAEFQAVSAEHLEYISDEGISALASAGTVAVSLPLASWYLREPYLPARKLLAAGVRVAVATDFNPGSAPSYHLPLAMAKACLDQAMTPQESLMGATAVAARAVGLEQSVGSLRPGFTADIALIDAPDLNHWLYHFRANACRGVLKAGQWAVQP